MYFLICDPELQVFVRHTTLHLSDVFICLILLSLYYHEHNEYYHEYNEYYHEYNEYYHEHNEYYHEYNEYYHE